MLVSKFYQKSRVDEDHAESDLAIANDKVKRLKKKLKEAEKALTKAKESVKAKKQWRKKVQGRLVYVVQNLVENESDSEDGKDEGYLQ